MLNSELVVGLKAESATPFCADVTKVVSINKKETQNFEKIPGLYATGNCCGRRFGPQYSTPTAGISIGIAITLGREAGRDAFLLG